MYTGGFKIRYAGSRISNTQAVHSGLTLMSLRMRDNTNPASITIGEKAADLVPNLGAARGQGEAQKV